MKPAATFDAPWTTRAGRDAIVFAGLGNSWTEWAIWPGKALYIYIGARRGQRRDAGAARFPRSPIGVTRKAMLLPPFLPTLLLSMWIGAAAPSVDRSGILHPDQLVILSTTDTKGKTSPCGCHIPKGGVARQAAFADSIKSSYGQVMWIDNGGYFPDQEGRQDLATFMVDAMKTLGLDAVGLGERDLRYGASYLKAQIQRRDLPVVCSNLVDAKTHKPWTATERIVTVGTVRVGLFALLDPKANLGPSRDSLQVLDPAETARKSIASLRKSKADVIVLMSQLGKADTEDLVTDIDGVDAVIVGHDTPLLVKGRKVKNSEACYGGEQGQYICQMVLSLDDQRHVKASESEAVMLGPDISEKPQMLAAVKAFEDHYNENMRKAEVARMGQAPATLVAADTTHHYVGDATCIRCHAAEAAQWKTTAHSLAWSTLVRVKKDATPECVPCHTVGHQKPGVHERRGDAGPRQRPVRELPRHGHRARFRREEVRGGHRAGRARSATTRSATPASTTPRSSR